MIRQYLCTSHSRQGQYYSQGRWRRNSKLKAKGIFLQVHRELFNGKGLDHTIVLHSNTSRDLSYAPVLYLRISGVGR